MTKALRPGPARSFAARRPSPPTPPCARSGARVDYRFWIDIQTDYDLEVERDLHSDELAKVTALVAT
jgi:hypothetical protein